MRTLRLAVSLLAVAAAAIPGRGLAQYVELPPGPAVRRLSPQLLARVRRDPGALFALGGWAARVERSIAAQAAVEGDLPIVAVPALFADSPTPGISAEQLRNSLFTGSESLRAFYAEASGGRLNIAGDAPDWVRTGLTRSYVVGSEYGLGADAHVGEYLVDALTQVDPDFDFSQYDSDGPDNIPNSGDDNGVVDAIAFYFLEVAASCGGEGIWPHFWGIAPATGAPFVTDDIGYDGTPIEIDPYFVQSIVDCSGAAIAPVSTIAHEAGHMLGLPDLYHPVDGLLPEQRRWVVGCWSLMAAGSWGCGPVDSGGEWLRPTHPGAWEKSVLGWLDHVEELGSVENATVTLSPVQTGRSILQLPLDEHERLLVEYRDTIGFDRDLPAAGVLVYAINDTLPMRPCQACTPVYRIKLLEADGDSALVETYPQGGDRGVAGDAYAALQEGVLTGATEPSTRRNSGLGALSDVNIYSITLEDGVARLVVSTVPISTQRLLAPLLLDEANPLTAPEESYLDGLNNANGRYDVGDLRAYLMRQSGG